MNQLRTYIARLTIAVLIWTGFTLYMVQPTQAKQSSQAFASWLCTMAKSTDGADLQKELQNLRKSGHHLDKIIKEASRIVSSNNGKFDFLFTKSAASQQLYQLLLIEWSQFQTGNAMASIPSQYTAKPIPVLLDKMSSVGSAVAHVKTFTAVFGDKGQYLGPHQVLRQAVVPLAGGIAINAP